MTKIRKRAAIQWYTPEQHGRSRPPSGPRYRAALRFIGSPLPSEEEWSVDVEMEADPSLDFPTLSTIGFVSDCAPHNALQTGCKFQLFEGRWPVAGGEVIN